MARQRHFLRGQADIGESRARESHPHSSHPTERGVRDFYDREGWVPHGGHHGDRMLWEDSRPFADEYQARCRQRLVRHLKGGKLLLDAGSGPVQHPEYRKVHDLFEEIVLLDISKQALEQVSDPRYRKILASIARIPSPDGQFDAVLCANVINHVHADQQEGAVRELLRVTRPGGRIVFVTYNPSRVAFRTPSLIKALRREPESQVRSRARTRNGLYWHARAPSWWARFEDQASVAFLPYRLLFVADMQALLPDSAFGRYLLRAVSAVEWGLPGWSVKNGAYYAVILDRTA